MKRIKPKTFDFRCLLIVFGVGLFVCQIIATLHVYLSNIYAYSTLTELSNAGYYVVPYGTALDRLREIGTAIGGGLFFTFTAGVTVSVFSISAAWIWVDLFRKKKTLLLFVTVPWIGVLMFVFNNGYTPASGFYLIIIPPLIFWLTLKKKRDCRDCCDNKTLLIVFLPFIILAGAWLPQYDNFLFVDFRDCLLVSNSIGKRITDFYYTYTLYPAQTFKSLAQKTIRTYYLDNISPSEFRSNLENKLVSCDYFPVVVKKSADVVVHKHMDRLIFTGSNRGGVRVPIKQFFNTTQEILFRLSGKNDRLKAFRQCIFVSLLFGLPFMVYITIYVLFFLLLRFILDREKAFPVTSFIILQGGLCLLLLFHFYRNEISTVSSIHQALRSDNWQRRVAALKVIYADKLEISAFSEYLQLNKNRRLPERYWLARSLAVSRDQRTYADLFYLLYDKNVNVRCMAAYALGKRNNPGAIEVLLKVIKTSGDWYEQMYAYKALKSLKWQQPVLSR